MEQRKDFKELRSLIDAGADIKAINKQGETALTMAQGKYNPHYYTVLNDFISRNNEKQKTS